MRHEAGPTRVAVTSYVPGEDAWAPRWPTSGPATLAAVTAKLEELHRDVRVLGFPVRNGGYLHWQAGACWVVLRIDEGEYVEHDGLVDFKSGEVLFHGPAPEAREYIRARGLPVPSAIPTPIVVADWGEREAGDDAILLGGEGTRLKAGKHSLVYASEGTVHAGDYGYAISHIGDVVAGEHGYALTLYGTRATAGWLGVAKCDEFGHARAGKLGVAISETRGLAEVGEFGVAVGLLCANAIAGDEGVALACEDMGGSTGVARAGRRGVAMALGPEGRVAAGEGGSLIIVVNGRAHVAHVGENGIEAGVLYALSEQGNFARAAKQDA